MKKYYPISIPQTNFINEDLYRAKDKKQKEAIAFYFLIKGQADEKLLEKSFNKLIYENDAFRLRFVKNILGIVKKQYIEDYGYEKLETIEVKDWNACENKMYELQEKMDISTENHEKQYQAVIITFDGGAVLFIMVSHYCFDGYSLGLTANRLANYYSAYERGEEPKELDSRFTIKKFLIENNKYNESKRYRENVQYAKNELRRKKLEYPFPARMNSASMDEKIIIKDEIYADLGKKSKETGLPVQFLITSAIGYTIYDLTGCKRFAIALFSDGRKKYDYENTIGCMTYVFPHYFDINPDIEKIECIRKNYIEYIDNIRHGEITMLRHGYIHRKNFDSNFMSMYLANMDFRGVDIDRERYDVGSIRANNNRITQMCIFVMDNYVDEIEILVEYQKELFSDNQIQKMKEIFIKNVNSII